jgi:hypothetical protein
VAERERQRECGGERERQCVCVSRRERDSERVCGGLSGVVDEKGRGTREKENQTWKRKKRIRKEEDQERKRVRGTREKENQTCESPVRLRAKESAK